MLSLRLSLAKIDKRPPLRIPSDVPMPCKSLRDTLVAWNHIPYALLVITPQAFVEELEPLVVHKNSTGIATTLRSLEEIYQAYPGRDEAEKVKRCLALFQPNSSVRYAMLVGDCDKFPVRYTKCWNIKLSEADPEFHTLYVPTDLYYAALFKEDGSFDNWDGDQDGYFGEVPSDQSADPANPDDVHAIPQLAVGRVLASTTDEVKIYVSKVMNYEKEAYGSSWAKAALLLATTDWEADACKKQDYIAEHCLYGDVHKLYSIGNPCSVTESPTPSAINRIMKEGVGFVSYIGHGGSDGWGIPNGSYRLSDVQKLENSGKLPVTFVVACDTARFTALPPQTAYIDVNHKHHSGTRDPNNPEVFHDTPPPPDCLQTSIDYDSMAEEMTVKRATGAVAYIGSTLTGNWPFLELHRSFFEAVSQGNKTIGDAWHDALRAYYTKHAHPKAHDPANAPDPNNPRYTVLGLFFDPWRYGLFGDPSLRVGGISH